MVYIVYKGKDDNGMYKFSVKKTGRGTILAAVHHPIFFGGLWWALRNAVMYQFLGRCFRD